MPLTKEQEEKLRGIIVNILGLETSPDGEKDMLLSYDDFDNVIEGVSFKSEVDQIMEVLLEEREAALSAQRKEIVEGIQSLTRDGSEVNFEEDNEAAHINATIDTLLSLPQLTGKQEQK